MLDIQIILNKINRSIVTDTDIERVVNVLRSGFLSKPDGGPAVAEFQKLIANLHKKNTLLLSILELLHYIVRLLLLLYKKMTRLLYLP